MIKAGDGAEDEAKKGLGFDCSLFRSTAGGVNRQLPRWVRNRKNINGVDRDIMERF